MKNLVIVGLDVHKDSISACAFAPQSSEVLHEQKLKNHPAAIKKLLRRIQRRFGEPQGVYEASSCGFVLYRLLKNLGIDCDVIAPSSIPRRSGEHVKNDRRDALKLATLHAASLLTPVRVPDPEQEAARALLRCRATLVEECARAKKRTTQFLLTRGFAFGEGTNWSQKFRAWLARIQLEQKAELPASLAAAVIAVSWKAQQRLYRRFHALSHRKPRSVAAVAIARELAGFLWEAMHLLSAQRSSPGGATLRQAA